LGSDVAVSVTGAVKFPVASAVAVPDTFSVAGEVDHGPGVNPAPVTVAVFPGGSTARRG